jgi:molecular chaperone HtpG
VESSVETLEFQAETRQLLRLVIHSVYSNKDIFLRELISNASDALDKVRLESLIDGGAAVDATDPHIAIAADPAARTLTVSDNGIGMSRDEVVDLIGTIARSGTGSLLEKIKESRDAAAAQTLIGQFGVGFYSAFMVAERVTLATRRAGRDEGTVWESDGEGTYTLRTAADLPAGTSVTLHLKPAEDEDDPAEYLSQWRIRQIVKQYSDFIRWPIRMEIDQKTETLNSMKALWSRPRSEVTDAEYHEFYKQISHDWNDPAEIVHMKAEGNFEYEALLFIPERAPLDLFAHDAKRGVQLYVKRVFIMDDCEALMPNYLRFVKGVVDAHDLSLNISREILQHDRHIRGVRRRLVKKILGSLADIRAKSEERYENLWDQLGRVLKEGLVEDRDNTEPLLDLVLLDSTHDVEKPTSLRAYVERMKEGQHDIYYLTGETRARLENSPHLEAFRAAGYEVLLLTDPVDEVWVEQIPEYDGHRFQSVAKGRADLPETESEADDAERARREEDFAPVLAWLGATLAEQVKEVRLTTRLTTSPACLVGSDEDMTPMMEKMFRALGRDIPPVKRILELNPAHPLVAGLRAAHAADPLEAGLPGLAEIVLGIALLAEGGDLADPARFSRLVTERLARSL